MCTQSVAKLGKALKLILADGGCRYLRPKLDYAGKVIHRELRLALELKRGYLLLTLHFLTSQLRYALIALVEHLVGELSVGGCVRAHECFTLKAQIVKVLSRLGKADYILIL